MRRLFVWCAPDLLTFVLSQIASFKNGHAPFVASPRRLAWQLSRGATEPSEGVAKDHGHVVRALVLTRWRRVVECSALKFPLPVDDVAPPGRNEPIDEDVIADRRLL